MSEAEEKSERRLLWRGIFWAVFIIGIGPLLYYEEDLRGAWAWRAVMKYWEDRGETFDFAKFAPSPVPDAQNLALVPLFEVKQVVGAGDELPEYDMPALKAAIRQSFSLKVHRYAGWRVGSLGNPKDQRSDLEEDFKKIGLKGPMPTDDLQLFDAVYPFTAKLRIDAATRPYFRLPINYESNPLYGQHTHPMMYSSSVVSILSGESVHELEKGRADVALENIKVSAIVGRGALKTPGSMGFYAAMSAYTGCCGTVYYGLARHVWNEAQLAEMEQQLRGVDFLQEYQFMLRTQNIMTPMGYLSGKKELVHGAPSDPSLASFAYLPDGWYDYNKAQVVDRRCEYVRLVDVPGHKVLYSAAMAQETKDNDFASAWFSILPWNFFARSEASMGTYTLEKAARMQAWIDEARIAVALERYRLAHGSLPAKLEVLVPDYLGAVPHDVIDGKPYRYAPKADGTYLLYSIGWNGTDDGGAMAVYPGVPGAQNDDNGDWVWPMPKK